MMPAFPANKQLMLRILIDLFAKVVHLIDIRRSDIVGASTPEVVNARWASAPEIASVTDGALLNRPQSLKNARA
jgi:hypothetical protein